MKTETDSRVDCSWKISAPHSNVCIIIINIIHLHIHCTKICYFFNPHYPHHDTQDFLFNKFKSHENIFQTMCGWRKLIRLTLSTFEFTFLLFYNLINMFSSFYIFLLPSGLVLVFFKVVFKLKIEFFLYVKVSFPFLGFLLLSKIIIVQALNFSLNRAEIFCCLLPCLLSFSSI